VQELRRVHRAIARVPALSAAHRAGDLSWAKLRLLVDIVSVENATGWIERASAVTCR